jgi:uroporphyrinogen decarboxylase
MREHDVFRHIADICNLYHSYGLKVIFHSDGYIRPIIPDLIDAGVDALAPIEIGAGLDLKDLKESFGSRVAFVGGVDLNKLRFGTVEEVREITLNALLTLGPGGGFIMGSDSEELLDVLPAANVIAMQETARECGRHPIRKFFPSGFRA